MATDWTADSNTKLALLFEDAAVSGVIVDSSTFGDDGTISNNTGVTQGATGYFDLGVQTSAGNNAKATFSGSQLDNLTQISICVWLYNFSFGNSGTISDKAAIYSKGYRSGALVFQTTNQLRWAEHTGNGTALWDTSDGDCALNVAQHYALTYDRTSGANLNAGPTMWIDGVQQTVSNTGVSTVGGSRDDDSGDDVVLFQDSLDGGETDSIFDELLVYNGIIDATDVNEIMQSGLTGTHGLSLEQEGYRWRADDADEDSAFWLASQDSNISQSVNTNTRLRVLINAVGDPATKQYQLEYRKVGSTQWHKITTEL